MELNLHQQLLEKVLYFQAICDALKVKLDNEQLKYLNKNSGDEKPFTSKNPTRQQKNVYSGICTDNRNGIVNESDIRNNQQALLRVKQTANKREKQLSISIQEHKNVIDQLKKSIQQAGLDQLRAGPSKYPKKTQRRIRQTLQLEQQIQAQKKMLNGELQQLNLIQKSSNEIKYHISAIELKHKTLSKDIEKQKEREIKYLEYKKRQQKYSGLVSKKQSMYKENMAEKQKIDRQVLNKINSIAQSKENLLQMERYEKQLQGMIMQQELIIQEIKKRQKVAEEGQPKSILKDLETIAYDQIQPIKEDIENIKRTVENRNKMKNSKKQQMDRSGPQRKKNTQISNRKKILPAQQQKSLFKIQIQPVCHDQSNRKQRVFPQNDIKITEVQANQKSTFKQKLPQKSKRFLSKPVSAENNFDLDTLQADVLKRIISKKQEQFQKVLIQGPDVALEGISFHPQSKFKKKFATQPIQEVVKRGRKQNIHQSPTRKVSANSRMIEELIRSPQNLKQLQKNIRIRTKKSEQQKYKEFILERSRTKNKKNKGSGQTEKKNFSLPQNSNERHFSEPFLSKLRKSQQYSKFQSPHNFSFELSQKGSSFEESTVPSRKSTKLKYASKVQTFSPDNDKIQSLLSKIQSLKKQKNPNLSQLRLGEPGHKEQDKLKNKGIKVYKLMRKPRNRSSFSYVRKGKAQIAEQSNSSQDPSSRLPQIKEEQDSIRNTGLSITYR